MYIRFIAGAEIESPTKQDGLFTEVEHLRASNQLESYQVDFVKKVFKYFNDNLPVPPYSSRKWPKIQFHGLKILLINILIKCGNLFLSLKKMM